MDEIDAYLEYGNHTRAELIGERMHLADELATLVRLYDDDDVGSAAQLNKSISACIEQIQTIDNMICDQEEEDTLAALN